MNVYQLVAFFSLNLLINFFSSTSVSAQTEYSSVVSRYKDLADDTLKVDKINEEAFSHWSTQPMLTEQLGTHSLQLAERLNYPKGIANSNQILGIAQWAMDNYEAALERFYTALPIYEALGITRSEANIYLNIASVFDDLEEYEKAKGYIHKCIDRMRELDNQAGLARAYNNAGVIYEHLLQYDSAIMFLEEAVSIRLALEDTIGVARAYNNIGLINKYMGNTRQSLRYYQNSLKLNDGDADLNLKSSTYLNIGEYHINEGRFAEGKAYIDSALRIATAIDSKRSEQEAYQHLKNMAIAQGDYKMAFEYFSREMMLDKSRINEESTKKIADLQLQYANEKNAREIAILESERSQERFYRNMTLLALAATILLGLLAALWIRFRVRKNREIMLANQALTEARLENALFKEKELTLELDQKRRELTAYTINFVQKSELLADLKDNINKIKTHLPEDYSKELGQLNRKVEESFKLDKEWEDFKNRFEQVHQDFFSTLKENCSEITSSELKLCALLKLNYNLKEAAQILGIAPESVKTARYRLKKKLGLKHEENLVDFVLRLDRASAA